MLVSTAYAQATGGAAAAGFDPMTFLPLILIFVVFYFMLIRPQQRKLKEHKTMLDALRRGDRVVTGGGIVGTVTKVGAGNDDEVIVEIAENIRVRVLRATISAVLSKPEPARPADKSGTKTDAAGTETVASTGEKPGLRSLGRFIGRK